MNVKLVKCDAVIPHFYLEAQKDFFPLFFWMINSFARNVEQFCKNRRGVLSLLAWINYMYVGTTRKSDILNIKSAFIKSSSFARLFLHIDIPFNCLSRQNTGYLQLTTTRSRSVFKLNKLLFTDNINYHNLWHMVFDEI